uniref:Uncharacterized protein n=1 Tax=Myoviridae sp. ctzyI3 TaxID=2826722 RepID=A0A8S5MLU2_9CAUD|nr:MAG TPA: hypothetical protein [Myoviridae sp. ctzyI3]
MRNNQFIIRIFNLSWFIYPMLQRRQDYPGP